MCKLSCQETSKPFLQYGMPKPPNVLWICTDQQRYDTIGALGNAHAQTPVLDRLVGEGACFENAFCQSPVCSPVGRLS